MAEKRKSSEKNNVGKKLVLGLIAVISLPILLVGLAGIIIMHLVQNTALNEVWGRCGLGGICGRFPVACSSNCQKTESCNWQYG